jgi:hypothetical protein
MTDSSEYQIDLPSATKSVAGRYDKLHEAGMATRFVGLKSWHSRMARRSRAIVAFIFYHCEFW